MTDLDALILDLTEWSGRSPAVHVRVGRQLGPFAARPLPMTSREAEYGHGYVLALQPDGRIVVGGAVGHCVRAELGGKDRVRFAEPVLGRYRATWVAVPEPGGAERSDRDSKCDTTWVLSSAPRLLCEVADCGDLRLERRRVAVWEECLD